ncbi:MAG: cyclase family protein [Bacteroidia bacterium]|nr:cyclase family protein [Bacteroidia bacterium]
MLIQLQLPNGQHARANLTKPHDLSITTIPGEKCVNAFHIAPPRFEPLAVGSFIGSVAQGGACNCENLHINAHGNGTHTECVGHISEKRVTINSVLKVFHCIAEVVSVTPQPAPDNDHVIYKEQLIQAVKHKTDALIIRTLPNTPAKLHAHYSGTNPVYMHHEAALWIRQQGYTHLLLDLPSVDREEDGGALLAHHAFWNFPAEADGGKRTITELIYVPENVADGMYLLNMQIASLETDASPAKPVIYELT